MPLIFVHLLMSCQSLSHNNSARRSTGQAQSTTSDSDFNSTAVEDLDGDPEAYTPAFFEQNDVDDETIFSDALNFLGAEEPLSEIDGSPSKICEDSLYYSSWKSQFDANWLAHHKTQYRTVSQRSRALSHARSDAYLKSAYASLDKINYDFPAVVNKDVASWIDYFAGKGRKSFVVWLRRGQELTPVLSNILQKNGLPKDLVYLAMIESGFNNRAISGAGAVGAWQFMPYTGRVYGLTINDWVDERRDPVKSTEAAVRYLTDLYTRFGSWHLAAGAYNCGEGCISRKLKQYGADRSYFDLTSRGVINQQTANYVPKIIAAMIIAKNPEQFGFDTKNHRYSFTTSQKISVDRSISLSDLADSIGVDAKVLGDLNPSLRLGVTPPRHALLAEGFDIRVPISVHSQASQAVSSIHSASQHRVVQAKITHRQTLRSFAQRYQLNVAELQRSNKDLGRNVYLQKGQLLNVPVTLGTGQYNKLLSVHKYKAKRKYTKKKIYASKRKYQTKKKSTSKPKVVSKKRIASKKVAATQSNYNSKKNNKIADNKVLKN